MINIIKEKSVLIKNFFAKALNLLFLKYKIDTEKNLEGYNVFGYVSKILGQGEVARAFVDELIETGVDFTLTDVVNYNHKFITDEEESKYRQFYTRDLKYRNNIFFIDLILLAKIIKVIPLLFKNKHNIVVFWWEFETGFNDRLEILNKFDEIYVFSDFIKDTLAKVKDRRFIITKIKYPFKKNWILEDSPEVIRENYSLSGKFCFFFNMDYRSSYNRKNPEGIITALYEEFKDEKNVILVIKTNNEAGFTDKVNKLRHFISDKKLCDKVLIIKEPFSRNSFMSLLNSMDCYISLHRGEGLGLGILEALALEKPVIATNYGGNTEYMYHQELAFPVRYTLVAACDDYEAYKDVEFWAEPDINDARRCMREVFKKFYRY